MPKLYEYFGLIVLFYSNEHEPIHVHGKYNGRESKAEIIIENGIIIAVIIKEVRGKEPLDSRTMNRFQRLVEIYKEDIVKKWIDFFVYNREISAVTITQKL